MARPELLDGRPAGAAEAERGLDPAGAARARGEPRAGREPGGRAHRPDAAADRGGLRGQPAVRRGAARDADRRRAAAPRGRPLDARRAGALPVPPTIQALIGARLDRLPGGRAGAPDARVGGGQRLPPRGDAGARAAALAAEVDRSLTALIRRDVIRPDRSELRRRRGLPLPPHPDPRRRLPLAAEGDARAAARALRGLARARGGRARARARGDRRLPPRAGAPLPRASWGTRANGTEALAARVQVARVGRAAGRSAAATARRRCRLLERAVALASGDTARRAELLPDLGAALIEAGRLADAATAARRDPRRRGRGDERAPRAGARPAGVPAAPARRAGRDAEASAVVERRSRSSRRPGTSRALAARCGCVPGTTGSRRGRRRPRRLGGGGGARAARRPRARADRHPRLDRVVAVLRADAGRAAIERCEADPRRGRGTTCSAVATCWSRWPACTRWRAASTRRARCSPRATPPSRSSGCR